MRKLKSVFWGLLIAAFVSTADAGLAADTECRLSTIYGKNVFFYDKQEQTCVFHGGKKFFHANAKEKRFTLREMLESAPEHTSLILAASDGGGNKSAPGIMRVTAFLFRKNGSHVTGRIAVDTIDFNKQDEGFFVHEFSGSIEEFMVFTSAGDEQFFVWDRFGYFRLFAEAEDRYVNGSYDRAAAFLQYLYPYIQIVAIGCDRLPGAEKQM